MLVNLGPIGLGNEPHVLGNVPYFVYTVKKNLILGCNNKFFIIKNEMYKK